MDSQTNIDRQIVQKENLNLLNGEKEDFTTTTSSDKDVFKGTVLIDRLLVYYGKFEGSRERAVRYAQKLLDLGHIESLTNAQSFEDSSHVYRWTDVAQVVNQVKARSRNPIKVVPMARHKANDEISLRNDNDCGKSILRISIETDNCDETEIQAKILASPRRNVDFRSSKSPAAGPMITTVEEDSFFGRRVVKTTKCVSDPTSDNMTNAHATETVKLSSLDKDSSHLNGIGYKECSYTDSKVEQVRQTTRTPEKISPNRPLQGSTKSSGSTQNSTKLKDSNSKPKNSTTKSHEDGKPLDQSVSASVAEKHASNQVDSKRKTTQAKSATAPVIVRNRTAGSGANEQNGKKTSTRIRQGKKTEATSPTRNSLKTNASSGTNKARAASPPKIKHNHAETNENNEKKSTDSKTGVIVATQTSEKSILHASNVYEAATKETTRNIKLTAHHPATSETINDSDDDRAEQLTVDNGTVSNVRAKLNQGFKTKPICREELNTLESEDLSDATNCRNIQKEFEHESANSTIRSNDSQLPNGEVENEIIPRLIPLSPSPPSPIPFVTPVSPTLPPSKRTSLKCLFWTKLQTGFREKQKTFWDDVDDCIIFDQDEFEKMFSKPPPSPKSYRLRSEQTNDTSKVLKVLGIERSRQVGIRMNSVKLRIDEIHDAIVTMDDEKLDLNALQALYDVRPAPEELDEIADILKIRPDGILDKPEQFILMLAMIPSLDERLMCWMFAKKFPDKMVEIQEQLIAIGDSCNEIRKSDTLRKVLEIVLLLGNHMNQGTSRGEAYGYFLDILPKLKEVKSQDGESTLLDYVVTMLRQQKKAEGSLDDLVLTPRADETFGLPDQDVLARSVNANLFEVVDDLELIAVELEECKQYLPNIVRASTSPAECETFQAKLGEFFETATDKLRTQAQLYQDTLLTVEDFQDYYVPNSESDLKDSLGSILRSVTTFCADFRKQWMEQQRQALKMEFYRMEKYKKQRKSLVQIKTTPSALKQKFLARRRRKFGTVGEQNDEIISSGDKVRADVPAMTLNGGEGVRTRSNLQIPKRFYKFADRDSVTPPTEQHKSYMVTTNGRVSKPITERASSNSLKLGRKMEEIKSYSRSISDQ